MKLFHCLMIAVLSIIFACTPHKAQEIVPEKSPQLRQEMEALVKSFPEEKRVKLLADCGPLMESCLAYPACSCGIKVFVQTTQHLVRPKDQLVACGSPELIHWMMAPLEICMMSSIVPNVPLF